MCTEGSANLARTMGLMSYAVEVLCLCIEPFDRLQAKCKERAFCSITFSYFQRELKWKPITGVSHFFRCQVVEMAAAFDAKHGSIFLHRCVTSRDSDSDSVWDSLEVKTLRAYLFLNAVYFRQGLTCTLGLTNDLIDGGQPRAKLRLRPDKQYHSRRVEINSFAMVFPLSRSREVVMEPQVRDERMVLVLSPTPSISCVYCVLFLPSFLSVFF